MNKRVSVDTLAPSPYIEKDSLPHRVRRRLTYAFAFRLIHKYLRRAPSSILEVGSGSGYFLKFCSERFPQASIDAVEYDARLVEVTRLNAPSARCIQGNAELFDFSPKKYEVIASFQVIEHLFDPGDMLDRVKTHLAPGGIFIFTSPNLEGIGARMMGKKWHGYRDDHVSLRGVDGWVDLAQGHGLECVYSGSTFFSGIPALTRLPLGIFNWALLLAFGSIRWKKGESFVGVFVAKAA